ncbi:MAG: insulinase family protein, partial [Saprospiraceae bacterium]
TYFKPNISYLVVVGDITKSEAEKLSKKYFGAWKASSSIPKQQFAKPKKPAGTTVDFVNKTGAVQSVINVTYPIQMKPGAPDQIKARVMNTLLGGFFRSRLNANLREDKAYTYGSRSSLSADKEVGFFNANASVRNEVTDSSLVQFMYELNKIRTEKITSEELSLVKNVMAGNFARSLEQPQTIARFALNTFRNKLPNDYYATYLKKLSMVTADDVLAMAKKYITPQNAHIVVVGNKVDVADKLGQFATSGKVNFYDRFGNPIKDGGMEIPAGVTATKVIQDYLTAIGGTKAINSIKDLTTTMTADLGGNALEIMTQQKVPNMSVNTTSMQGMTMQAVVFDGNKGMTTARGQSMPMPEDKIADAKISNHMIPESVFEKYSVKTKLIGMESVNGKKAYAMEVTFPSGKKSTYYFDLESSLKVREVSIETEGGRTMTISADLDGYKAVNGVKFPHKQSVSGVMPVPLVMEVKEIKANTNLDDSIFKIK